VVCITISAVGQAFVEGAMYLDGLLMPGLSFAQLRKDAWLHMHFETLKPYDDDINLMSRSNSGDANNVQGALKVYIIIRCALVVLVRLPHIIGIRTQVSACSRHVLFTRGRV
jgi:hypothetical protein